MNVITISREFGAGGHTIGLAVAKRLGIEFYDRDIILNAAKASGLDFDQIVEEEEKISKADAFFRAINPVSYDIKDTVFDYERAIILEFARKEPCVILGRCGDAILDDAGIPHTSVFLHADEDDRMKRASELIGSTDPDTIRRAIRKRDALRRAHYSYYAGRKWGDVEFFDIALNSGTLGYDCCIDIICRAVAD